MSGRKERDLLRALDDVRGHYRTMRRLAVAGTFGTLAFLTLVVFTAVVPYVRHTMWGLQFLWVILGVALGIFTFVVVFPEWAESRSKVTEAERAHEDYVLDGDDPIPDDKTLEEAIDRVVERKYGYDLRRAARPNYR